MIATIVAVATIAEKKRQTTAAKTKIQRCDRYNLHMPAEIHDRWDRNFRSQRLQGSHAEADQGVSISLLSLNTVVAIV